MAQQRNRIKDLFSLVRYDDSCLAVIRHVKSTYAKYNHAQIYAPKASCFQCDAEDFFKLSGQQILWGRNRHKNVWNSWGYNFVSFQGEFLKLIQATILDSRNILD